jgi:hypothetical protein
MNHRAALECDQQRVFVLRQSSGRELCAIEQAIDLIGGLALSKDEPSKQSGPRTVSGSLPSKPPAKPGAMAKKLIKEF